MKTAIIIFPPLGRTVNPESYLTICANKVKADGYVLLHSSDWADYREINIRDLQKKLNSSIDTFYFFVDFGVCSLMTELIAAKKDIQIEITANFKQINIYGILLEVSKKATIPIEVLKMKTRKREIVEARQIYFKRAKETTKSSLAVIGELVGKDHATVLHGIKIVNNVKYLSERYNIYFNGKIPSIERKPEIQRKVEVKPIELKSAPELPRKERQININPMAGAFHGYFEHARQPVP